MAWFDKQDSTKKDDKEEKKEDDVELKPADVKAKLDKIDGIESKLAEFDSVKKTSERMSSFLDEQDAAKRRKIAEDAAAKATKTSEESEEEWTLDPKKAFEKSISPLVAQTIRTNSRLMRKEIFDENPGDYEFYTGEFKTLVDEYIDKLPLNAQNDTASIKNCYNVVLGMKHKDIVEGKVKSKFSAQSSASGRTGTTEEKDKPIVLTELQKKTAKGFGMSEAEYAKAVGEELNYV